MRSLSTKDRSPLHTAGTPCQLGSLRPTLAALLAGGVAWCFTPGELEEWARDSIFGTRAKRRHLRDDLDAFDKLSLIQRQHQEPSHA